MIKCRSSERHFFVLFFPWTAVGVFMPTEVRGLADKTVVIFSDIFCHYNIVVNI